MHYLSHFESRHVAKKEEQNSTNLKYTCRIKLMYHMFRKALNVFKSEILILSSVFIDSFLFICFFFIVFSADRARSDVEKTGTYREMNVNLIV